MKKKAWEMAYDLYANAKPTVLEEGEQGWSALKQIANFYDSILNLDWHSNVPGSGAPEVAMIAAVQALENRGYIINNAYELLKKGMKAHAEKDMVSLHKISAELRNELLNAKKNDESDYWKYTYYNSFDEYEKKVNFPEAVKFDVN